MADGRVDGAPRRREPARLLWSVALGLSALGALGFGYYLLTRGECREGYVRLIDLGPALLVVALVWLAVSAVGLAASLRPGRHPVLVVLGVIAVVLALALAVMGVGGAVQDGHGTGADCWTF